jgi:hypothetical protein
MLLMLHYIFCYWMLHNFWEPNRNYTTQMGSDVTIL